MSREQPLLAVLIDADNFSPNWAEQLFDEIATLGEASVRRVYGDFSSDGIRGWTARQAELGFVAHHQPANTVGKNASDIALVIDAMDLMHSGRFDGFVIVSSDSDFTRLAQRLREQGKEAYGIGEKKTPKAFVNACKRFIYVENLLGNEAKPGAETRRIEPAAQATNLILTALRDVEDDDGWAGLGAVGSQLAKRYPDFDPRSYGAAKLSSLVKELKKIEVSGAGGNLRIRYRPKGG